MNEHGIHSPFVFDFYESVVKDDRKFYAFETIEEVRESLKLNQNEIIQIDFGQGSNIQKGKSKTIGKIAATALSFPYQCRVMFRLVDFLKPKSTLELGTSLGISTSYLAFASQNNMIYTLEGDPNCLSVANQVFRGFALKNVKSFQGPFQKTLKPVLREIKTLDLVFMDGHHDEKATIDYFETILPFCHKDTVIIVDDIYWSEGMRSAWKRIKENENITLTLDLYFCGIVFLRTENKEKEHFKLRPHQKLFWR